jgi:predicted dehydrogenase
MNVDPGHFHAALVQKDMYDDVSDSVYVFAPQGPEVENYLSAISAYNSRSENPTSWKEVVSLGPDFFEKMLSEKPGNVMVVSGNNAKKTDYIHRAVSASINVLADKPMIINPAEFSLLVESFEIAKKNNVLLYDIMTERFEITSGLQKALAHMPDLFGSLQVGSVDDPAITKESVHHYSKLVSGNPIKRPAWFFDVSQQGEGIVDVTTHLVDLVFWECYPEQIIDYKTDVQVEKARHWSTELKPSQFEKVTQLSTYPDYLQKYLKNDSILEVYANGEIVFKLKDTYAKVSVIWNFEAPPGTADTHYSIMRGTKANLIIRQGVDEQFKPTLYVEPLGDKAALLPALEKSIAELNKQYSGLNFTDSDKGWIIQIPDELKVGHEAHFAQVTRKYLEYLESGNMPDWEVPNMIAKYFVTTEGLKKAGM